MHKCTLLIVIAALVNSCVEPALNTEVTDQGVVVCVPTETDGLRDEVCAPAPDASDIRYKDIDDPADTPAPFKATYTNSNNPWVAGCVIKYSNRACSMNPDPQKLDACDGVKLNEAVTDNSRDCVEKEGAHAEYDCDQECKNAGFKNGTCETKAVADCGTTKVGYCVCGPKAKKDQPDTTDR
jgi:hypothetical protein